MNMTTPEDVDPTFAESFSEWLDSNNDSLPEPESFSEWLNQNDDAILQRSEATASDSRSD